MSRSEHTYRAGDVEVALIVPDGIAAPSKLLLTRSTDGAVGTLTHASVRVLRAPVKRGPRRAAVLAKLPDGWAPSETDVLRAREVAPSVNLDFETAQFVDWALSKGEARADWAAAWRGWMRRTHARNVEKGWKPATAVNEDPRARWLREHGVTADEYEARKGDAEWLEMIKRRGKVA